MYMYILYTVDCTCICLQGALVPDETEQLRKKLEEEKKKNDKLKSGTYTVLHVYTCICMYVQTCTFKLSVYMCTCGMNNISTGRGGLTPLLLY